jgi:hypothetical protein
MMRLVFTALIMLLLCSALAFAGEYVVNGTFEEVLSVGWSQKTMGSIITITRGTGYDPDPDYEAYVRKGTGSGYAELYQIFDISTTEMEFSANLKLNAYDTGSTDWAGAALIITYLDENEAALGATYIARQSSIPQWINGDTKHVYNAPNTDWNYYSFNIDDEFAYLTGINKDDVAKLSVSLFAHVHDC